ncbi:MAG: hypothetical protein Q7T71_20830 [Herbiconiux sp.]|nr:hypothetical protein [Herbiconiux sp.]
MSSRSHRTIRRCATVALLGAAATVPSSALAAASTGSCPDQPTTKAFAKWGDDADYSLVPGGNFENGSSGWSFTNAKIGTGNETAGVLGGLKSVAMGNNWFVSAPSVLTSPPICVSDAHPYFRYLLKANGPVGLMATFIKYENAAGNIVQQQVQSKVSTNLMPGKWKPSELNPLSINLDLAAGETTQVRLVFVTPGSVLGAGYNVDNVLVDPYRRG